MTTKPTTAPQTAKPATAKATPTAPKTQADALSEARTKAAEARAAVAKARADAKAAREAAKAEKEKAAAEPKAKSAADYRREIDLLIIAKAGELVTEHVPAELRVAVAQLIANQLHHLSSPKAGWAGTLPVPERSEWAEVATDRPSDEQSQPAA